MGTRVDRHAVTLAIRARRQVVRGTGVQARVTADSVIALFSNTRADKWAGGQAGGRASDRARAPGRPGGWVCRCAMRTHTRWSGGQMRTFQPDRSLTRTNFPNRNPAPRTPHPAPCTRYPMLYPCTPHPAPYTLYPLPYRVPGTPDTGHNDEALWRRRGAQQRELLFVIIFSRHPPVRNPIREHALI